MRLRRFAGGGQRGYAGTTWWKAMQIENNGWMAVGNVGVKAL